MSSSTATASAFSIFAITCAVEPDASIRVFSAWTSEAVRTKESATKSQPSSSANWRSSMSFFVSDGIGSGIPGRLTPLLRADRAGDDHLADGTAALDPADPQPDGAVVDQDVEAGLEHRAEHGRRDRQVAVLCRVLARDRHLVAAHQIARLRELSDPELRPLQVGDQRDRPADLLLHGADRLARARRGPRAVPCEKLRRAPSITCISGSSTSGTEERGPDRGDDLRAAWNDGHERQASGGALRESRPARVLGALPSSSSIRGAGCTWRRGRSARARPS